MKNYKLDVVRYNNEDVIATSSDVDLTAYPTFLFSDPTDTDAGHLQGKLHLYTYNPFTGIFDYNPSPLPLNSEIPNRTYMHAGEGDEVVPCEHWENHTFSGGPLNNVGS